jgi:hypothetical protein
MDGPYGINCLRCRCHFASKKFEREGVDDLASGLGIFDGAIGLRGLGTVRVGCCAN